MGERLERLCCVGRFDDMVCQSGHGACGTAEGCHLTAQSASAAPKDLMGEFTGNFNYSLRRYKHVVRDNYAQLLLPYGVCRIGRPDSPLFGDRKACFRGIG